MLSPARPVLLLAVLTACITGSMSAQLPTTPVTSPLSQPPSGEIVGRVTDAQLAVLPGAEVLIAAGAWSRDTVTDLNGAFRLKGIPPGTFTAWFHLQGFATAVRRSVTIDAGSTVEVNVSLQVLPYCSHCPEALLEPYEIAVYFDTTAGNFIIAVDSRQAPITAQNFLTYVDGRAYDGGQFHRATRADNYVVNLPKRPLLECVQAGINPSRRSDVLPPIPLERTTGTGLKHVVGTVSMARGAADSATSEFFILLNDQPSLDFGGMRFDDGQGAAAFGRVVAGMEIVRKIQAQPTSGQSLTPPITILSAKRVQPSSQP